MSKEKKSCTNCVSYIVCIMQRNIEEAMKSNIASGVIAMNDRQMIHTLIMNKIGEACTSYNKD